ncbi:sulfurtransferase TusA family protein [Sphingomonas cavernae]|uniref:Sulfurtransferase TusA family protein n=1 Tax=Sphingomonas cavernae TaxID=2320861 RepID=A0A418W7M3_9SPHN|nr:sulfurtransferase TusA family protein [Sphingomonas cavernae]RJF86002.1 sulfurtransferase TusA family protein [Sphingomonas cavernae]
MTPLVDARGMRCPWPVLRLARAAREAGAGATIRIVADDPIAAGEIAALAEERGWAVAPVATGIGSGFEIET